MRDCSRRPPRPPDGPFGIRRFLSTGQNLICGSELGFGRCVAWRSVGTRDVLRDFRPLFTIVGSRVATELLPNPLREHT
jgi:hypothetical protein